MNETAVKLERLKDILRELGSVALGYSGGVDSTFLASVAAEVLGEHALAVTAVSPSLAPDELEEARALAQRIGIRHLIIETHEMDDPNYVANPVNRCYYCKTELFTQLTDVAAKEGIAWMIDGFNYDDRGDFRPGHKAAKEHGVRSPLSEAELTKEEIRTLSRERGLPTWDKPALACLSSRIPYGTPVTLMALERIGKAEQLLRSLGLRQLRVRHHDTIARIETDVDGFKILMDEGVRDKMVAQLKELGYTYVTLDLAGYRMGSLNEVLKKRDRAVSEATAG